MQKKKAQKKKTHKKNTQHQQAKRSYTVYEGKLPLPLPVKTKNAKIVQTSWENPTAFELLEDIPIPWTRPTKRDIVYPFEGMRVGKSFQFMQIKDRGQNVYSAAVSYCRQPENFHKKFVTRKIKEDIFEGQMWTTWGCWREEDLSEKEVAAKQLLVNEKQQLALKKRRLSRI